MNFNPDSFLGAGYKRLDLKFIFDNLRNVGIASAIFVAGSFLMKNGATFIAPNFNSELWGTVICILALLLLACNFLQFVYLSASLGTKTSISCAAALAAPRLCCYLFIVRYIYDKWFISVICTTRLSSIVNTACLLCLSCIRTSCRCQ